MKRVQNAVGAFADLAWLKLTGALSGDPGFLRADAPQILVFGYMGIGDLLMLAPALQHLKQRWPSARITLLTGPYSAAAETSPLLPVIDEALVFDWKSADAHQKKSFAHLLREKNFDALLATYTAPVRFFMPLLAHVPIRVGMLRDIPFPQAPLHPWDALRWKFRLGFFEEEFFKREFFNRTILIGAFD